MQASQYIPGMGAAAGANLAGPMTPGTFQGLTPQQRQQRLYQMQLANQSTQMGNATRSLGAGGPAGSMGNAPNMAGVAMTPQLGANAGSGSNMMGIGSPAGMGPVSSQLQPAMGSQQAPGALRQPRQMSPSSAPQYHNPEYFVRMLQQFMRARGQYLNPQPVICGRPVELLHLFNAAMRLGGSKRLTTMGGWPMVAGHLGFPPAQHQAAAAELQNAFARNLLQYEVAVRSRRKQVESQDLRQQAVQTQMAQQQQSDSTGKPQHNAQRQSAQQQMPQQQTASPARPAFSPPPPSNASQQYQGQGPATPSMRESPVPPPATVTARTPSMKGRETNEPAQQLQGPARRASVPRSEASAASAYANGRPQQVADSAFTMLQPSLAADRPSPANADHTPSRSGLTATMPSQAQPSSVLAPPSSEVAEYANRKVLQQPFKPSVISDSVTHGPINVDDIYALGEEISRLRPSAPHFMELGIIDIHALTMGLRSGLHAEVRLALDTLATVTSEPNVHLMLDECPELVDALIECGEEEVQVLAANAPGTGVPAESMTLAPYEEVLATAQYELLSLKPSNEFSSLSHDLDRSVDRLICVTSVLRNLSFAEHNFAILSSPPVVKFIATTVHAMATRHELLRTSRDTLDVMKDLIVLLSNVAHMIAIPGREEALCLLAFLLAFAPAISDAETSNLIGDHGLAGNEEPVSENYTAEPECTDANLAASLSQPLSFQPFDPSVHRYLPLAVDTLAKLLARDDPNRTLYKAIFAQDSAAFSAALAHRTQYPSGACDLMSRTFGLATCSLPSPAQASLLAAPHLLMMLDVRKPMIMQSMLAADVITSMLSSVAGGSGAPAEVSRMARAWLNRADGWAPVLGRVIALLLDIMDKATAMAKHPNRSSPMFAQQTQAATDDANISILRRGLTILRRLATHAEAKPSTRSATTEPGPLVAGDDATLAADTGMAIDDPGSLKTAASLPANRFSLPASVFLRRERVLAALLDPHVDAQILKDICDFSKHGTV
ncbi:hypothetical protein KEM52_006623 [Ascosphaera acerosa]|nr:hypothetical protein KEM52_006623 [Ascosphaera acerosa]